MLNAYVWQQDGRRMVQLRGPIESTTGQMLPAPVPLSPPMAPMTPPFSSSSRNSSMSTVCVTPNSSALSSALGTRNGSRDFDFSNVAVASTASRSCALIPIPPPSVGEYGSDHPNPADVHGYKVTIRNLSQETAKERIYTLVEDNTHAFVQMIQPEYITLRQVHGQLHAYVKFIHEQDAVMAVQQLHGYKFMGRTLQVTLG